MSPEPTLRQLLHGDLAHALQHNGNVLGEARASMRRKISVCFTPALLVCIVHRLAHWLWTRGGFAMARCCSQLNLMLHHIDIHPACSFGPGLYIPHPAGVLLRGHAGADLVVLAGAGLADHGLASVDQWPTLGDDVWIASRARVCGAIEVGSHVRIGPGVTLTESVPSSCKVLAQC